MAGQHRRDLGRNRGQAARAQQVANRVAVLNGRELQKRRHPRLAAGGRAGPEGGGCGRQRAVSGSTRAPHAGRTTVRTRGADLALASGRNGGEQRQSAALPQGPRYRQAIERQACGWGAHPSCMNPEDRQTVHRARSGPRKAAASRPKVRGYLSSNSPPAESTGASRESGLPRTLFGDASLAQRADQSDG